MADNKQSYIPKVIESPSKGLHMDIAETAHIRDTYPFALNALLDDSDGHDAVLSTENSNKLCDVEFEETHNDINGNPVTVTHSLSTFYQLGSIELDRESTVLFLTTKNTGVTEPYKHAIVLLENDGDNCKLTTIGYGQCLNFDIAHSISGVYRVRRGCERTIYFTDYNNAIRTLNIDAPPIFTNAAGYTQVLDCDDIKLQQNIQYPSIEDPKVISGGNLLNGSYSFSIQLLDEDFNETKFLIVTKPINIYVAQESKLYHKIVANTNISVDPVNGSGYASKKIQLNIRNLDRNYAYYRIAVMVSYMGSNTVDKVYLSTEKPITASTDTFELSSLSSGFTSATANDVFVNVNNFDTAEQLAVFQNRLIAVNTKGGAGDLCSYQKLASKIAVNVVAKEASFDGNVKASGDGKNPTVYWDNSLMPGETYALGVIYVFKNGNLTPAYHIPGRPLNRYHYNGTTYTCTDDTDVHANGHDVDFYSTTEYAGDSSDPDYGLAKISKWKIYDSSQWIGGTNKLTTSFYRTTYEHRYNDRGCDGADYWGTDFAGGALLNEAIRHHRMPDRARVPLVQSGVGKYMHRYELKITFTNTDTVNDCTATVTYAINNGSGTTYKSVTTTVLHSNTAIIEISDNGLKTGSGNMFSVSSVTCVDASTGGACSGCSYVTDIDSDEVTDSSVNFTKILLGLEFSNVEYPANEDVIGHFFVIGKATEENKLIKQRGYFGYSEVIAKMSSTTVTHPVDNPQENAVFTFPFNPNIRKYYNTGTQKDTYNPDLLSFISPEVLVGKGLSGDYITLEMYSSGTTECVDGLSGVRNNTWDRNGNKKNSIRSYSVFNSPTYSSAIALSPYGAISQNRVINAKTTSPVAPQNELSGYTYTVGGFNKKAINASGAMNLGFIETDHVFVDGTTQLSRSNYQRFIASLREFKSVYVALDDIQYNIIDSTVYQEIDFNSTTRNDAAWLKTTFETMSGDTTQAYMTYMLNYFINSVMGAATSTVPSSYPKQHIVYLYSSDGQDNHKNIIKTTVGSESAKQVNNSTECYTSGTSYYYDGNCYSSGGTARICWAIEMFYYSFFESNNINFALLHKPNNSDESWYEYERYSGADYILDKRILENKGGALAERLTGPLPEHYEIKDMYNRTEYGKTYRSIPIFYDCCNLCSENHEHRVRWSGKSFDEERFDNWRIFDLDEYKDIPSETGRITNAFVFKDSLFIHTPTQLYEFPNPMQEKTGTDLTTYIGTGAMLSVGPFEIGKNTGSEDKYATVITKDFVLFVNRQSKKIQIIDKDKKNVIDFNDIGINSWLTNKVDLVDLPYSNRDIISPLGTGFIAIEDRENNRILITLRKVIPHISSGLDDPICASGTPSNPRDDLLSSSCIGNYDCCVNRGWTLSFNIKHKVFASFHSYIPNIYFHVGNHLFSTINDIGARFYKHNIPNKFLTFYNIARQFIVENMMNYVSYYKVVEQETVKSKVWDSLEFETIAYKYNEDTGSYIEDRYTTFNSFLAYNTKQSTGKKTLIVEDKTLSSNWMHRNISYNASDIQLNRKERTFYINRLRDYVIDYNLPIFNKDEMSVAFNSEFFIDKVVNTIAFDNNKSWNELQLLRDKWLRVRFYYNPEDENIKILYYYTNNNYKNSDR